MFTCLPDDAIDFLVLISWINLGYQISKINLKHSKNLTLVLKKFNLAPNFWGTRFPEMKEIMGGVPQYTLGRPHGYQAYMEKGCGYILVATDEARRGAVGM